MVEIKALQRLSTGIDEAQVINYLKASRLTKVENRLLNFGTRPTRLNYQRIESIL